MPFVSIGQLGRDFGVDPKAIRRAVVSGQLTRRKDGLFNLELAREEWAQNHMHERGHNNRSAGVIEMANPGPPEGDLPLNGERPAKSTDYAKARAVSQLYDARLKKLNYEVKAKSLVPARDVEDAAHRSITVIKEACAHIPSRIAAQIALETNVERCYAMLEREIDLVFSDFAEGKIA